MIISAWQRSFTAQYGHQFPPSYLCFDTEFTGSDAGNDLIVEIGHTLVEDGVVVDRLNLVLNWYKHPQVQSHWLDYKLNNMRAIVGPSWRLLPHVLQSEGQDPVHVLKFYSTLFDTWRQRNLPFVAQNGQAADERLIRGNFARFLRKTFDLPKDNYFDTGAIFKADQIWNSRESRLASYRSSILPQRNETLKAYFQRVCQLRISGVKWGLKYILEHYDLIKQHNVDVNSMHNAGYDSLCLHWVMAEYHKLLQCTDPLKIAGTTQASATEPVKALDPELLPGVNLETSVQSHHPRRKQRLI